MSLLSSYYQRNTTILYRGIIISVLHIVHISMTLFWWLTLALASNSLSTVSVCPFCAAISKGTLPSCIEIYIRHQYPTFNIRESVDSLCRDGADTPMPPYIGKAFTRTNFKDLSLFRYLTIVYESLCTQ